MGRRAVARVSNGNRKAPPLLTGLCLAVRAAYLRVAHMYMLISIPTVTSTILGAFQATLASPFDSGLTRPSSR
jgi:hypothetical protein